MRHTKTLVIDAAAHVLESERTWDYLERVDCKYRPVPVTVPADPSIGRAQRDAWMIDGKIRGLRSPIITEEELVTLPAKLGRDVGTQQTALEMGDVELRIQHMDALDIDIQVLHNTVFIESVSDRPGVEVPLCRAWNRWMADVWRLGQGRLRWVSVPPLHSLPDAIDEIRFGQEHGAVGLQLPPFAWDRLITDSSFYSLFAEAERLDLPIVSYIANATPWLVDLFRAMYKGDSNTGAAFPFFLMPSVIAVQALLLSPIHELFPRLRWGIIEANAQWLPYVLHAAKEHYLRRGEEMPQHLLRAKNVYVACQYRDDVPYIISRAGDDCLVIGTDYGHTDMSSDVDAIAQFRQRTDISARSKHKIISDNPQRFYGL